MDGKKNGRKWLLTRIIAKSKGYFRDFLLEEEEAMKSYGNMMGIPVETSSSGGSLKKRRAFRASRLLYMVVGVLIFGVFLTFVNIYELRRLQGEHYGRAEIEPSAVGGEKKKIVWVAGKKLGSGYLKHVFAVFERLGYLRGLQSSDWDVLWSHDYPFVTLHKHLVNLKPHQRVNHFPGSGFITNKVNLATSNIKGIPKAFRIPKDKAAFKTFAQQHPEWKWVQKSNNHRGVKILSLDELDLNSENTFIQQYVDDPFLIDGRRFDIGVYTAVTSINPLRIYINKGDWLIRFCPQEYHPFDPTVLEKYVVNDNYMPVWKVPSLQKIYVDLQYTFRDTLITYLQIHKYNVEKLEEDIAEAIRGAYLSHEKNLIAASSKYASSRNFFELVRFDFVLDRQLNVYLLEVNMSPNLSSGHFPPNRLLYEQVVFGLLNLVGIARTVHDDLPQSFEEEAEMQVSSRDIQVLGRSCSTTKCEENCAHIECRICGACMTTDTQFSLKRAYLEHLNRRTWRRVMPRPFKVQEDPQKWEQKNDLLFKNLTVKNQNMFLWFRGKCLQDSTWCS